MIVAELWRQIQIGRQKSGTKLCDKLFHGITLIAKTLTPKIAVEARGMAGPVNFFVRSRRIVAFRIAEAFKRRHLHEICETL